jgi:transposase
LPNHLREHILAAVDNRQGSRRRLAARLRVDVWTSTQLLQLRRPTGSLDPRSHGGGTEPTLDHEGLGRLRTLVEETPNATLEQLRQGQGVSGSIMIVWRSLKQIGITRKKKRLHATERDGPEVQQKRGSFQPI